MILQCKQYQTDITSLVYDYRFEYGIGTQVMLASSVYNPIREKLIDSASKVLNKDEVDAMKRKLADVRIKCTFAISYVDLV